MRYWYVELELSDGTTMSDVQSGSLEQVLQAIIDDVRPLAIVKVKVEPTEQ